MISIRGLIQQLKTGLRNLIIEILGIFKTPFQYIRKLFSPKEEEIEIPEEWKNPEAVIEEAPVSVTPVAVEPLIVFKEPMKTRFRIRAPSWFLKSKRLLALFLLIGCCISAVGLVFTFPIGLVFVIPTAIINLDYLLKTQSKVDRMLWYMLPDLEEVEE